MAGLRHSDDLEPPTRIDGFDFRPSSNQAVEAFFRMDTPEGEYHALARGSCNRRHGEFGKIDPVGNDRDGIGKAEIPDLFVFLLARSMNTICTTDYRSLKQCPEHA